MKTNTLLWCSLGCAAAVVAQSAMAATYASNPTGPNPPGTPPWVYPNPDPNAGATFGSQFRVGANTSINQLGIWDEDGNGLATAHDVGLYNSTGTLLAQVHFAAGTGAMLDGVTPLGGFRWLNLPAELQLAAGQEYVLGASYYAAGTSGNDDAARSVPASIGAPFQLIGDRWQATPTYGLVYPTDQYLGPGDGFFGPNARYYAIPEPSVMVMNAAVLLAAGVGGWIVRRRSASK